MVKKKEIKGIATFIFLVGAQSAKDWIYCRGVFRTCRSP